MASAMQDALLHTLTEANKQAGIEYEDRRLEACHCNDFNKNKVCTKPDKMAKALTRQLVIEDSVQDDARIERMVAELQQKTDSRADDCAKLDKLIDFWGTYMAEYVAKKAAAVDENTDLSATVYGAADSSIADDET